MTTFSLELVTPSRVLWAGDAEAVSMRTDAGEITFLAHHSPFIGALDITVVRIEGASGGEGAGADEGGRRSPAGGLSAGDASSAGDAHAGAGGEDGAAVPRGEEIRAAVHGGFVHVDENRVVVLGSVAELASEIDVGRARRALETATEKLVAEPEDKPDEELAGRGGGRDEADEGAGADAAQGPPGGAHGAFVDPDSPAAAVARAKVRLEAAGEPAA
jgi:F-type H+-transporting ATPase subunit epsilon